jgi:sortase (surface protein transpeptidase)
VRRAPAAERRRWAPTLALTGICLLGAALLVWAPWRGTPSSPRPVAAVAAPSTVAPTAAGAPAPAATSSVAQAAAATHPATGGIVPTRLRIPAIGVDALVEHRGTVSYTNPFTHRAVKGYGVPESMRTTSWWSDGPEPGSGQMAVVLGHLQVGGPGVFNRLTALHAGDAVTMQDASGAVLHLRVLGAPVTGLDKATSALADTLDGHPAGAAVALVTCGGTFDSDVRSSEDNTVVFAALA